MVFGIDAISAYVPKLCVILKDEWCAARANVFANGDRLLLASKIEKGIGVERMSVPDMHEDAATLAANAFLKLLRENDVHPAKISHLAIATETGVDQSKSIASYVLGMIEDAYGEKFPQMGCIEYKFACVGATYALESALAMKKSGMLGDGYAVVIATDIARYKLETPGEFTQGSGAVAMLIKNDPRLLEIDVAPFGTCSANERDFFRPNGHDFPVVDGKYSVNVYCDVMSRAFDSFLEFNSEKFRADPKKHSKKSVAINSFEKILFHIPFPKMAKYAFERLCEGVYAENNEMQNVFNEKTKDSLNLAREVGNIYSGSLYLSIISMFENAIKNREYLEGKDILLCSYGSGASSKVFSAKVANSWRDVAKKFNYQEELKTIKEGGPRKALTMKVYEILHKKDCAKDRFISKICDSVITPKDEFALKSFGQNNDGKIDYGLRYYSFIK